MLVIVFLSIFYPVHFSQANLLAQVNINEAVEHGLGSNLEVLSAKMDISIAEANEITAALRSNPSLFIDSQLMPFSGKWQQSSSGGPTQKDLVLSVPLDLSGKRSQRKVFAKLLTEQKKIEFFIYQLQKSKEIKNLFVEILASEAKIKVIREHQERLEKVTRIIKNRIRNTNSQPLLVGRIDIYTKKVAFRLKEMMTSHDEQLRNFCIMLGKGTDCDPKLKGNIQDFPFKSLEPQEELLKFIADNNPFARQLAQESQALVAERKLIRRNVWDDVTLSAGVSHQDRQEPNPSLVGSNEIKSANSWMVGLSIPLPVFNRGQGDTIKADYGILKNEKQRMQLTSVLESQVKTLYSLAKNQNDKIVEYEKTILPSAQKINSSAQNSFKVGSMTAIEYLDANQVFIDSYSEYYDLIAQRADTEFQFQVLKGQM